MDKISMTSYRKEGNVLRPYRFERPPLRLVDGVVATPADSDCGYTMTGHGRFLMAALEAVGGQVKDDIKTTLDRALDAMIPQMKGAYASVAFAAPERASSTIGQTCPMCSIGQLQWAPDGDCTCFSRAPCSACSPGLLICVNCEEKF